MNCRLLTGRRFLESKSSPHFFGNGWTKASFHSSAKYPDCRDISTMDVTTGKSSFIQWMTIEVGIGSNLQDFSAERRTMSHTSSLVSWLNCAKESVWQRSDDGSYDSSGSAELERLSWIFWTFRTKYKPMSFAATSESNPAGKTVFLFQTVRI